jgi:hypothetical protein
MRARVRAATSRATTMKCTLCSISPVMKCTLRERRSSLETISGRRADLACSSAAACSGRSNSASAPAPVWISWCRDLIVNPSRSPNLSISERCAA